MRLRALSIIRNEIDILELFLRHCDALFDEVVLIDHRSFDGSTDLMLSAVAQRPNWRYYKLEPSFYYQEGIVNYFLNQFRNENFDYFFLLDADEFVWVRNRQELEAQLSGTTLAEDEVLGYPWFNAICSNNQKEAFAGKWSRVKVMKSPSTFQKVIIPGNIVREKGVIVSKGNHLAMYQDGTPLQTKHIGRLFHLPIRSRGQVIRKAITHEFGNLMDLDYRVGNSYQFRILLQSLIEHNLDESIMTSSLYLYHDTDTPSPEWVKAFQSMEMVKSRIGSLGIAFSPALKFKLMTRKLLPLELLVADLMVARRSCHSEKLEFEERGKELSYIDDKP